MDLSFLDWAIIGGFLLLVVGIGLSFRGQAGKDISSFFLGGRSLPWYIAGLSMVATTFAADTPLAVTELVADHGISGNWLWWNFLAGGMLTVFFFARLWRRSGVLTEAELVELRYSGAPARFLRIFKAIYLGLIMNVLIIGWVNLAMISILEGMFELTRTDAVLYTAAIMLLVAIYSSVSGLLGIAFTDAIQFVLAMGGCIALAIIVVNSPEIGGMEALVARLPDTATNFFPSIGEDSTASGLVLGAGAFLAHIAIQWWASWYPGAEPGGGGYVAQRMMSVKTEQGSVWATLFFQIAHYCIRPWPWIVVALCAVVLYPDIEDKRMGYVLAMRDYLPNGLRGIMLAAFIGAYMSTISTQLNWGASYLVNDVYKGLVPDKGGKQLVTVSRVFTLLLMVVGLVVTMFINSISGVWSFIIECGAGLGLVLILRWYWWRINAWSEIVATFVPFVVYFGARYIFDLEFPNSFFLTVGATTVSWIVATFVTAPVDEQTLKSFRERVQPDGWWNTGSTVDTLDGKQVQTNKHNLFYLAVCWIAGIVMTYSVLFFTGKAVLGLWNEAGVFAVTSVVGFVVLATFLKRTNVLR